MYREKATKKAWKTVLMPEEKICINYQGEFTIEEYEKIKLGFIPHCMEKKL